MEVGRIIGGKYRLQRPIGEGAMGSVWAAEHDVLGRTLAIKFMRPTLEDAHIAAARFVAEAKAAAQIKHRFVVDVFDFGITDDGVPYMVQELLTGRSLADVMEADAAWPVADVVQFAAQCLSGLAAVHGSGVVHRDLKPENIFVITDADGRYPKLLDFGVFKAATARAQASLAHPGWADSPDSTQQDTGRTRPLTAVGRTLGTPAYMAPEQLSNASDLDARADLYSLGALLYQWLGGRCPYDGSASYAKLQQQIMQRRMTPLATLRPDLNPALCIAVTRALAPDRGQRFADAAQMRDALLAALEPAALATTRVQATPTTRIDEATQRLLESAADPFRSEGPLPRPGRHLGLVGALAVASILALGLSVRWPMRTAVSTQSPVVHAQASEANAAARVTAPAPSATQEELALEAPPPTPLPLQHAAPSELPWGADMPEETPEQEIAAVSADTEDQARSERRSRRAAAREALHTQPAHEARRFAEPSPSNAETRLLQPKVVRQLDF